MARTKSATENGNFPVGDSAFNQDIWWFDYADGFTLSAWVRPTSFNYTEPSMGMVISKYAGGVPNSYWVMGLETGSGKIKYKAGHLPEGGLTNVDFTANTGLTLNIWQFIAIVRDGVTRTITAYLSKYVDVDVSSDGSTADVTAGTLGENGVGLYVGCIGLSSGNNFIGDFGHVSIVKKALTLGELRNLKMGRLESAEVINDWRMISHVYSPSPTLEADYAHQSATPAWGKYSLRVDTVHLAETNPPVPKPWGLEGPYNTASPAARGSRTFYRKPFFCPR